MNNFNMVLFTGNLVEDAELVTTEKENNYVKFTLGHNHGKDNASFINFVAWNGIATKIQACKKGQKMTVIGYLKQESWEDKEGKRHYTLKCICSDIAL